MVFFVKLKIPGLNLSFNPDPGFLYLEDEKSRVFRIFEIFHSEFWRDFSEMSKSKVAEGFLWSLGQLGNSREGAIYK